MSCMSSRRIEQGLAVLLVTVRFALRMLQFVDVGLHIQLESLYAALVRPHGIGLLLLFLFLGAAWLSVLVWVFTSEVPCFAVLEDLRKKNGRAVPRTNFRVTQQDKDTV